jgi:Mrp family chromosome partitioning ATPase
VTTGIPWDLGEPATPEHARAKEVLRTATARAPSPDTGEPLAPAFADTGGSRREEILSLVQRIIKGRADGGPLRSVMFVGIDREGSADVCAAAAEALADHTAGSICLVDANLSAPGVHAVFGVEQRGGFSDLLHDRGDVRSCVRRIRSNLWLLSAGSSCAQDVPMLAGEQACSYLTQIRNAFDLVLVNSPSIGSHSAAIPLASAVDAAVLVVEANITRREVAKKAVAHLMNANVPILGGVLTNRTFPIPEAIYRKL